ncbi:single-stranded DNA-binding protein [Campylobacter pinnipediorum subsp. pinnipediorum]|nr:single-stranded DNA-binding protein [Campylobacter pinnipediorum subsp. pinnipediorum]
MFNKVILVGHLTKDIELRFMQSNTAIGKTSVAVNRKYTINNEKMEKTMFIDIVFFARLAEIANEYIRKGVKILIEGRLVQETWQSTTGQNRSKHVVVVENMQMLGDNTIDRG